MTPCVAPRWGIGLSGVLLAAVLRAPLAAQAVSLPDSTVTAQLASGVFRALDDAIARAALGDSAQAVELDVPNSPEWAKIGRHIMRALNGRRPDSTDTVVMTASVSNVRFERDTLSAYGDRRGQEALSERSVDRLEPHVLGGQRQAIVALGCSHRASDRRE